MALEEARNGPVLWMTVGSPLWSPSISPLLQEAADLTCQRLPIATPADSKAALEQLLVAVRSQRYGMVVLDCVPALSPPPPGAAPATAWGAPPQAGGAASAAALGAPAAAGGNAAPTAAAAAGCGGSSPGAGAAAPAAAGWWEAPTPGSQVPAGTALGIVEPAGRMGGTAADGSSAAVPRGADTAAPWPQSHLSPQHQQQQQQHPAHYHHHHYQQQQQQQQQQHAAMRGLSMGVVRRCGSAGLSPAANLKFLHNVLPVLLEGTLADLAASCGPGLRTTTLLLNTYNRQGHGQEWYPEAAAGGGGGSGRPGGGGGSEERSRWARSAIVRHAAATLHVSPSAAASAVAAGGGSRRGVSLHAVLTEGQPSGEDGSALFSGSLVLPVRIAEPHRSG